MYPGTKFEWIDNSAIEPIPDVARIQPVYLTAITSDKGTEDMILIEGDDFYKQFGTNISFVRHGQPLLQAANIINAGGKLLVKRVVADDALLANIIIAAKITKISKQKVNLQGQPLYEDGTTGEETTTAEGNTAIMIDAAKITYEAHSATNCKSFNEAETLAETLLDETGTGTAPNLVYTYPLFVSSDSGRGLCNKKIKIVRDYSTSRNSDYVVYIV
jgi:hypothetical protein